MRITRMTPSLVFVLLFTCVCAVSAGALRQGLSVTVDDPRPLASAVAKLEDRFGWIVTYEDPRYLHADDAKDVTAAVHRGHQAGQPRVLVPRGGPFTFVEPAANTSALQEQGVLRALLEQYAASGYPGRFTLRRTGSIFHVIPTGMRSARGAQEPYTSVLDNRISQSAGTRTLFEAVQALAAQVGLEVGRTPMRMFRQLKVTQADANDTARSLLLGILKVSDKPLSWRVLCPPGDQPCVLNIRVVGLPLQGR